MPKARILVVDDAIVFRKGISDALNAESDLEVVGTAPNGKLALGKIAALQPDAVVLDVEMPELDGLGTLHELRRLHPSIVVVMCSSTTVDGAKTTIEALSRGATDFVAKPSTGSLAESITYFRAELAPKLRHACRNAIQGRGTGRHAPPPAPRPGTAAAPAAAVPAQPTTTSHEPAQPIPSIPSAPAQRIDLVVIGVSTGGPNALAEFLPRLPGDLPVPILIVQHMPPMFTRLLAERLAVKCAVQVHEAAAGTRPKPGEVWIAPGGQHLVVDQAKPALILGLNQEPPENSCRPAVDVLLRSAVRHYGANLLSIVLTGMGEDGLRGVELIRRAGGQCIVQDKPTSVVWGMPGAVAKAGLAERVLPLTDLPRELCARLAHGRLYRGQPRHP
jgi:two-component system chemotaxis response regulator CheB